MMPRRQSRRHLVIEPPTPWCLSPGQVNLVRAAVKGPRRSRSAAKLWRVKAITSRRPTICRSCRNVIPPGPRLRFRHLNIAARRYDLQGDLHCDPVADCEPNLIYNEIVAYQVEAVADRLKNPDLYEDLPESE
jgi:hypothetical protein